ncbi:protein bfr2-like [Phragmites australis]|uniref:protein bfr2-like n=1 Tax=Phragmites australis TaxID=29695 RepID=UPI002D79BDA7|nr:protein bfr2-like [Phragmites australis]
MSKKDEDDDEDEYDDDEDEDYEDEEGEEIHYDSSEDEDEEDQGSESENEACAGDEEEDLGKYDDESSEKECNNESVAHAESEEQNLRGHDKEEQKQDRHDDEIQIEEDMEEKETPLVRRLRKDRGVEKGQCELDREQKASGTAAIHEEQGVGELANNKVIELPLPEHLEDVQHGINSNTKKRGAQQDDCSEKRWKKLKRERLRLLVPADSVKNENFILKKSKSIDDVLETKDVTPPIARSNSWDFPAPECNIMKFIDINSDGIEYEEKNLEQTKVDLIQAKEGLRNITVHDTIAKKDTAPQFEISNKEDSDDSFANIPEEMLQKMEEDARRHIEEKNVANLLPAGITYKQDEAAATMQSIAVVQTDEIGEKTPATTNLEPATTPSTSGTLAFEPTPRRLLKIPATMRSLFIDYDNKNNFKCSKVVCMVYNAVCRATGRTTRSSQSSNET